MDFIPTSNEVMVQQLNRRQNTNTVWTADIQTLALSKILVEEDDAFLDVHDNIRWLEKEKFFTWTSERDGWLHLYKVSRDGKTVELVTEGEFDVERISHIDPASGFVYYIASPDNFTQRYLYRSSLKKRGKAERLHQWIHPGKMPIKYQPIQKFAIHTFQNTTTPPMYSLVSLPTHKKIRMLEENIELKKKHTALGLNPKEFFKVDIGDVF